MIRALLDLLVSAIIRQAQKTPYTHLYRADGALYMGRWWLFQTRWFSARVHHIATADFDRHFHDHPFSFVSLVLRGFYVEKRPATLDPCFRKDGRERSYSTWHRAGSIALRKATDRHLISMVPVGGVWTLFIQFPKCQWWGFYMPQGKVHWRDYVSEHQAGSKVEVAE